MYLQMLTEHEFYPEQEFRLQRCWCNIQAALKMSHWHSPLLYFSPAHRETSQRRKSQNVMLQEELKFKLCYSMAF